MKGSGEKKVGKKLSLRNILIGFVVLLALVKLGIDIYGGIWDERRVTDVEREGIKEEISEPISAGKVQEEERLTYLAEQLKNERLDLHKRKRNLVVLEKNVKKWEGNLQYKIDKLIALEQRLHSLSMDVKENEAKRISSLTGVYENMDPEQAARVIESMDIDMAVSIFLKMGKRQAGRILGVMNPQRASNVSEAIAMRGRIDLTNP